MQHSRIAAAPTVIEPRPLHNEDASLRALARQTLMDLEKSSLTTPVPTATLALLLSRLCELLSDRTPAAVQQGTQGALLEAASNPNLRYWQSQAERDEEHTTAAED